MDSDEFRQMPDDDDGDVGSSVPSSSTTPQPSRGNKAPIPRSAIPTWLNRNYADTRERLTAQMKSNSSGRPTCYTNGTFIDGTPYTFFAADHKTQPSPEDFYQPRYFVWLPHCLVKKIPCPGCLANKRKGANGSSIYLRNKGWPKAPRRVVDLEECIYIIGYRYVCGHQDCKKTYTSWSPSLVSALPRSLAMEFTHHLTFRSGLTDRVVSLMRTCFQHGIGSGPFAELIRTNHIRRYEQRQLQYLEMVYVRLQSSIAGLLAKFEPFGVFDDREGYAGFSPCPNYYRSFYVKFVSSHAPEMDQYTAMLSADVIQIDHSYKVSTALGYLNKALIDLSGH